MDDLAERIKAAIENPAGELWFPELTADLAACAWNSLHSIGLTPDNYGTERVLSRSTSVHREIITALNATRCRCATTQAISIEALSTELANKYQEQGVGFYSADDMLHTTILSSIEDALAIINQVPSLMRTVVAVVRSLHLIRTDDEDYDVSFSEPRIPFSIFVSVPKRRIAHDALRVAEAIVHEAMHLQLTLIEGIQPLVNRNDGVYFSPWRREQRNAQGLFHGLYVFNVIDRFLGNLNVSDYSDASYLSERRSKIGVETNLIPSFSDCSELTLIGSRFVRRLSYPSGTREFASFL